MVRPFVVVFFVVDIFVSFASFCFVVCLLGFYCYHIICLSYFWPVNIHDVSNSSWYVVYTKMNIFIFVNITESIPLLDDMNIFIFVNTTVSMPLLNESLKQCSISWCMQNFIVLASKDFYIILICQTFRFESVRKAHHVYKNNKILS